MHFVKPFLRSNPSLSHSGQTPPHRRRNCGLEHDTRSIVWGRGLGSMELDMRFAKTLVPKI